MVAGWSTSKRGELSTVVKSDDVDLTAKQVREIAKDAGIIGATTKRIETLKSELRNVEPASE